MKRSSGLALMSIFLGGCGLLGGGETPGATTAPTGGAAATGAPTSPLPGATPAGSAPAATTGGAPVPVVNPPADILPPDALARVVVDALNIRNEPDTSAAIATTAGRDETLYIVTNSGTPGPVDADGFAWYPVYFVAGHAAWPEPPPGFGGVIFGWVAAASGGQPFIELVPVTCPAQAPDLPTLIAMTGWARLACYSGQTLTLSGYSTPCEGCGGVPAGRYEPEWLAHPQRPLWLRTDPGAAEILPYRIIDGSGVTPPAEGTAATFTGHFDDPASTGCEMTPQNPDGTSRPAHPSASVLYCREQFVVTQITP